MVAAQVKGWRRSGCVARVERFAVLPRANARSGLRTDTICISGIGAAAVQRVACTCSDESVALKSKEIFVVAR